MFVGILLFACQEDTIEMNYAIDLKGTPEVYESLNENANLEIPIAITSEKGLKKAYYKIVTNQENTYKPKIGPEINIPVSGNSLDTVLSIPVTMDLNSVVIAVYDTDDIINLRTIKVEGVNKSPVITFKNDIDFRKTAAVGINFKINGNVTSENELKQISFTPVNNGNESTSVVLDLGNKSNVEFVADVPVEAGLDYVLLRAENTLGGISIDTFKVLNVVSDDFINLNINGNLTELNHFLIDEKNTISGVINSGSDIKSLKYIITKNDTEGVAQPVTSGVEDNELEFNIDITGEAGMQSVKLIAENNGGKTMTLNLPIPEASYRANYLKDVVMSTDPADDKCFFSAYKTPHVYGIAEAKSDQLMVDWILTYKSSGAQPVSGLAYGASSAYYENTLPYLQGFTQLTYLYLTSKRSIVTEEAFNELVSEADIKSYIDTYIFGPAPEGQNYNVYTSSRRVGDTFNESKSEGGFVIAWGTHTHPTVDPAVVNNVAHALVWVKRVTQKANGHWEFVFDIKYPKDNQRTANNQSVIAPYDPYPL